MSSQVLVCISHVDVGSKVLPAFLILMLKIPQGVQVQKHTELHKALSKHVMADYCESMDALHMYPLGVPQLGQSDSSGCCVIAPHDIRVFFLLLFC
jgi:hypothetical protein